jgi:hypothetical protein
VETSDARNVLRVLASGFPNVTLSDDNVTLYVAEIADKMADAGIALAVATDWIETRLTFPKIAELIDEYRQESGRRENRRRAVEAGQRRGGEGYACSRCHDTRFIELDDGGVFSVLPCPECQPDDYEYWTGGHYATDHEIGLCEHPKCEARAKRVGRHKAQR